MDCNRFGLWSRQTEEIFLKFRENWGNGLVEEEGEYYLSDQTSAMTHSPCSSIVSFPFRQPLVLPNPPPTRFQFLPQLEPPDNILGSLGIGERKTQTPSTLRLRCHRRDAPSIAMVKSKAIRVHELGGPEVLRWEEVEVGEPGEGEIRIRTTAVGVNFIDIYFRKGVYAAPTIPFTPGMEAVGVVTAVGPGLTGRKVGDVVAYAGHPMGSYAQEQILPAAVAVPLPPSVDHKQAASVMLKGMTAHVLLRRVFKVESGHTVLVHAAAGGVGSLLCQWANALGATVIGTVSNQDKAAQAAQDGCHHPIIYTSEDVVARVKEITSGKGVNVVYDSVGKDTYKASLECLASRGFLVSFGQSSGKPDPVPMSDLASKSLFLTRPSLMRYTATRDELLESAGEVFANVANGVLRVRVNHTYPLSEAAQAHADLEGRKTSGSIVLIPDTVS